MKIKRAYTRLSFECAVEQAKHEGYIFLGYTYNAACFKGLIIARCYEDK